MPNRAHELVIHCLLFFLPRTKTKKKDYSVGSWHFVSSTEQLV